jgi:hypothetical protein
MSTQIDKFIAEKDICSALEECARTDQPDLGLLLGKIAPQSSALYYSIMSELGQEEISDDESEQTTTEEQETEEIKENVTKEIVEKKIRSIDGKIKVQLLCNWCSSETLARTWNKMSQGEYTWNNITLVWGGEPDYYVVVNKPPPDAKIDKKRTILFRMEPHMERNPKQWGEWADPDPTQFLKVCKHNDEYNNNEWHLSKTYSELKTMKITKTEDKVVSTVLSAKYKDPGHIKRVDFVKFLERNDIPVHVYGSNHWDYKDYKGSPPYHCKDEAMFPYKYVFNAENHSIKNYYTEKVIDGILAECLVFYNGCFNLRDFIDERAFVYLELSNMKGDSEKIKKAMEENLWEKRLPYIREAKKKILEQLQFFPRIERIIEQS